jgi:hypothetical protein
MERMSTLDAGFFFVEHKHVPMHLGSLMVFEGPPPAYRAVAGLFTAQLPLMPRYRQVVRTVPLHVFHPAWADDEKFEIGYHVRHAAVPKPGRARQLRQPAGRIFAQRLDRDRPLWEAAPGPDGDDQRAGPRFPLFVLGRKMVEAYPYVPIGDNVRISVAIFSYLDRFSFGITADYSAVPDLDVLTKGIRRGLAELQAQPGAARRTPAPAAARRAPAPSGAGRRAATPPAAARRAGPARAAGQGGAGGS